MTGCLGPSRPAQDADLVARAVAAVALAALGWGAWQARIPCAAGAPQVACDARDTRAGGPLV